MKNVMVVRPDWSDQACRWGAEQLKRKTIAYAELYSWNVIDLYANKAIKNNIFKEITGVSYGSLLGHGNETTYTAQRLQRVFIVNDKATRELCSQLTGTGLNFLSCLIGSELLPWMVENGLRCAVGYTAEFIFAVDQDNFPNSVAEYFFNPHTIMDSAVFKGASMLEAHDLRLEAWEKSIDEAPMSIRPYLVHDYNCDMLFGDGGFKPLMPEPAKWYTLKGSFHRESSLWDWMFKGNVVLSGVVELQETEPPT